MPIVSTLGAASSRGFGEFNQQAGANFIEDYFSTYLYTGTGINQNIPTGIPTTTTAEWNIVRLEGGSAADIRAIKTDSSGNIYVSGYIVDGGIGKLVVAKFNSSFEIQWQKMLNENSSTQAYNQQLFVGSSGDVYITGQANNGTKNYCIFAKYNSSGTLQWQRGAYDTGTSNWGAGIAEDSAGNVYVCGALADGTGVYIGVLKYDSSGTFQWVRKLKDTGASSGYGICIGSDDSVYICGSAVDATSEYCLTAKYNSSGTLQWQRNYRVGTAAARGYAIARDSSNNVYVAGRASDGTVFNLLLKYTSTGSLSFQRRLAGATAGSTENFNVCVDSSNNVYVAGYGNDSINRGLIAKYNSSGTVQWQRYVGRQFFGIDVDSSGNLFFSGTLASGNTGFGKIKQDGTTTSGTALTTMYPGLSTATTPTGTSAAGTATGSTPTPTTFTSTATDGTPSITKTVYTQAAVSGVTSLVWLKQRSSGGNNHALYDTARGTTVSISSNLTSAQVTQATSLTDFSAQGFNIGSYVTINSSSEAYVAWTFREKTKFFDVITYTGNGANRTIAHNLGSVPGMILIKSTSVNLTNWAVYHRSLANTEYLVLNDTAAKATGTTYWNSTTPTATEFSLGTATNVNANGYLYVAYLFAHDAGGFGLTGADNVISCGSVTTDAGGAATVTLGWEPQFILIKKVNTTGGWYMLDNIRGNSVLTGATATESFLSAETSSGESNTTGIANPTSQGFQMSSWGPSDVFVYMAVRRSPMKIPTDGTTVFQPTVYTGTNVNNRLVNTTIAPDMVFVRQRNSTTLTGMVVGDRLRGQPYLLTGQTSAEASVATAFDQQIISGTEYGNAFSSMNGFWVGTDAGTQLNVSTTSSNQIAEAFKRAPKFFDQVCWTTSGNTNASITHNLTIPPELIIAKRRNTAGSNWVVYATGITTLSQYLVFNTSAAVATASNIWGLSAPTATTFNINETTAIGSSGTTAVAYIFGTCPGVSKVGTYTGTGTTNQINCGFTSGARLVLIKRTDTTGDWYIYDSARGIVAGNDPYILLNSPAAEVTSTDYVDAYSAGFELSSTAPADLNANGGTFIYLAIA